MKMKFVPYRCHGQPLHWAHSTKDGYEAPPDWLYQWLIDTDLHLNIFLEYVPGTYRRSQRLLRVT